MDTINAASLRKHGAIVKDRIARTTAFLERFPLSIFQLLFRLGVASVFLKGGLTKVASWQSTLQLFIDEYKVPVLPPEVAATLATIFELGCSSLLIAGLFTRLATLPLLGMIMTIQLFVYPNAYSEHLVWGSILLFLLMYGAGSYSLDHIWTVLRGR